MEGFKFCSWDQSELKQLLKISDSVGFGWNGFSRAGSLQGSSGGSASVKLLKHGLVVDLSHVQTGDGCKKICSTLKQVILTNFLSTLTFGASNSLR